MLHKSIVLLHIQGGPYQPFPELIVEVRILPESEHPTFLPLFFKSGFGIPASAEPDYLLTLEFEKTFGAGLHVQ